MSKFSLLIYSFYRTFTEASNGRGKGCGRFSLSSRKLSNETTVVKENYQMMSVVDETDPNFPYQMVLMYLSNGCSFSQVVQDLSCLLVPNFTTIIIGDLNFDKKDKNDLTSFLSKKKFSQQVSWPTHIQGRTLDHCYVSKNIHVKVTRHSPYYSDHSALCIEFRPVGSDQ